MAAAVIDEPKSVSTEISVDRWSQGATTHTTDQVAEEVPIAIVFHNVPHVVMLATPANFEDFAVGFTLSEGLVGHPDEIREVEVTQGAEAVDVRVTVVWERFTELLHRRRNLTGRTGCGLCGAETADDAIREVAKVGPGTNVTTQDLHAAIEQLGSLQPINARTGSVHAAAWVVPGKGIQLVREDVGRHNALDKLSGALARAAIVASEGMILLTSRGSVEMVQKSAAIGAPVMVSVSAPTALAVRIADAAGITLAAIARADGFEVFTHPCRIAWEPLR